MFLVLTVVVLEVMVLGVLLEVEVGVMGIGRVGVDGRERGIEFDGRVAAVQRLDQVAGA